MPSCYWWWWWWWWWWWIMIHVGKSKHLAGWFLCLPPNWQLPPKRIESEDNGFLSDCFLGLSWISGCVCCDTPLITGISLQILRVGRNEMLTLGGSSQQGKCLITMLSKCLKDRVVPLTNGLGWSWRENEKEAAPKIVQETAQDSGWCFFWNYILASRPLPSNSANEGL